MEAQSSKLDHLHLPLPPDSSGNQLQHRVRESDGNDTGVSSPAPDGQSPSGDFSGSKSLDDGDDVSMVYHDDEHAALGSNPLLDNSVSSRVSDNIPLVKAPLPLPDTEDYKHIHHTTHQSKQYDTNDRRANGAQPPKFAISLQHGKLADFRPWTDDAVENALNDTIVRTGFADKLASSGQSESNMARPIIWPNLKNKNVLPALSTLFVQIMDKRQSLGRCTAASTFKPPPRVTLTDTKREAWLRDLASTDVPLRRLSRTIPHGIRNKVLLDQCLVKRVPLARAIWLVKCVGANEIRAFRRKGISGTVALSGELKWIKEWTACVKSFVEGSVAQCGQSSWRSSIHYTTCLIAAMFADHLLDRAHFLDWIITSFAKASPDYLPIWTMYIQLFWTDCLRTSSRGRRLSEAILLQSGKFTNQTSHSVFAPLVQRLDFLLERLSLQKPSCLVALSPWSDLQLCMQESLSRQNNESVKPVLSDVLHRNALLNTSSAQTRARLKPPALHVFEYLDHVGISHEIDDVMKKSHSYVQDIHQLASALVDWACTLYRTGVARTYLAVRLLRNLVETNDMSLEPTILKCLPDTGRTRLDQSLFNKLVFELVASGHFNFGKYLQWLISTGSFMSTDNSHIPLLLSIPLSHLSPQSLALRQAIMSRLGSRTDTGDETGLLRKRLAELFNSSNLEGHHDLGDIPLLFAGRDRSTQLALCHWIVEQVEVYVSMSTATKQEYRPLPSNTFVVIRTILEQVGDLSSLNLTLKHLLSQPRIDGIADYADTVRAHAVVLANMGELQGLTARLCQHQTRLRHVNQFDRMLISSLLELCRMQAAFKNRVPKLEQDLITSDQQYAAAVCSPASDSVLTVQAGDIKLEEDIDRILASGNMMDEQLLARLFSAIVERTVKWTAAGSTPLDKPCRWFAQLRLFDVSTFDRHMNKLVAKLVANAGTDQVRAILIALVASGCLKIEDALKAFEKRLEVLESSTAPQLARFAVGCLQTFLPLSDLDQQSSRPEIYRFRIAQRMICDKEAGLILRFFWHGMIALTEESNLVYSAPALSWLAAQCIRDSDGFSRSLYLHERHTGPRAARLTSLLWSLSEGGTGMPTSAQDGARDLKRLGQLIQTSDELRLPYIRLVLAQVGSSILQSGSSEQKLGLRQAFEDAVSQHCTLWPQLMDGAGTEVAQSLHRSSCNTILDTIGAADDVLTMEEQTKLDEHLKVAATTASEYDEMTSLVIERIADGLHSISSVLDGLSKDASRASLCAQKWEIPPLSHTTTLMAFRITSLVQLAIICSPSEASDKGVSPALQRLLNVMCSISAKAPIQLRRQAFQLTQDAALLVARSMSAEQKSVVYKKLSDPAKHDPHVQFILDHEDSETKWLSLSSRVPMQPPPTASPTTAQASSFQSFPRPTSAMPSPRAFSGSAQSATSTPLPSPQPLHAPPPTRPPGAVAADIKYSPYFLRRWEMMQDPTPNVGENDTSISLQLFAARKVS